jgi:hypothetical protein
MPSIRHSDDELWRHDWRWLGPKGYTLPVSLEGRGILPGGVVFLILLAVLSAFGVGAWRFLIALAAGFAVMKLAGRFGSSERPLSSIASIVAHETGAPRPQQPEASQAVLRPSQLPVHVIEARQRRRDRQ